MDTTNKYGNSSFWMDRYENSIDNQLLSEHQLNTHQLYRLAAKKRAISNFVSIVTSKQIPVKFASIGDSYTDGSSVVISSKLDKNEDFDVAVGLALHEGSHIKLSSFELLEELRYHINSLPDSYELGRAATNGGVQLVSTLKNILNWVEDRRIDNFIYQSSSGYRQYYIALYDKYFNDPLIDKALKSTEFTDETFDSYMFRLINLQSQSTRLNALKGLREISKIADLGNIGRLQSTMDAFEVAVDIFRVIVKSVNPNTQLEDNTGEDGSNDGDDEQESSNDGGNSTQNQNSKNELSDDEFDEPVKSMGLDGENDGDDDTTENDTDGNEDTDGEGSNGGDDEGDGSTDFGDTKNKATGKGKSISVTNLPDNIGDIGGSESVESDTTEEPLAEISLSDRQKSILKKKIDKQKDFLNGKIAKSKISKAQSSSIDVIEKANAEITEVGNQYETTNQFHNSRTPISCIFVKNMTMELLNDRTFPLVRRFWDGTDEVLATHLQSAVDDGIRLGAILGKKLQTRSESRETVFNRQLTGKLDRRLVSALGYGSEQIFYTKELDNYNKANLHISIDASGSMSGSKWRNTITNTVALAKAVDMIPNLEIQITFRTTSNSSPYIIVAYDSRTDKFSKVKQLFPYLNVSGTTPEGLCFEAISKYMVASSNNLDSYFLNISDGEPYFQERGFYYAGIDAAKHTKKMVDNMKRIGIKVLSYFVDENHTVNPNSPTGRIFKHCYGDDAKYINVTSVNEVSKTINGLFLKK